MHSTFEAWIHSGQEKKRRWTQEKMDVLASVKTEQAWTDLYPVVDVRLFRIYINFSEYRLYLDDDDLI
jgi:hypothetical protein